MEKKNTTLLKDMDKRIIEMKIMKGQIKAKELEEYLQSLPDVSENAEEFIIELEEDYLEYEEEDEEEDGEEE